MIMKAKKQPKPATGMNVQETLNKAV